MSINITLILSLPNICNGFLEYLLQLTFKLCMTNMLQW